MESTSGKSKIPSRFAKMSSSAPVVDFGGVNVSESEILSYVESEFEWQCTVCCETQPFSKPSQHMLDFAKQNIFRQKCLDLCVDPRSCRQVPQPADIVGPIIDKELLSLQICRDCSSHGLELMQGEDIPQQVFDNVKAGMVSTNVRIPSPSVNESNYDLILQLVSQTLGSVELAKTFLEEQNIHNSIDIDNNIQNMNSEIPTNPIDSTVKVYRSANGRKNIRVGENAKRTFLGYSREMLRHDKSLSYEYKKSLSLEERENHVKEEIMMMGNESNFVPKGISASEPIHNERPDRLRAAIGYLAVMGWLKHPNIYGPINSKAPLSVVSSIVTPDHFQDLCERVSDMKGVLCGSEEAEPLFLNEIEDSISSSFSKPLSNKITAGVQKGDSYLNHASLLSASFALGTTASIVQSVDKGLATNGLVLVRPPGHHACSSQSTGFCVFNNVAGAVKALLMKKSSGNRNHESCTSPSKRRILILDLDIHHGDGTEEYFYDSDEVLVFSIHRYDESQYYPCTGHPSRIGTGVGEGYNVNVGLNGDWHGDASYIRIIQKLFMPIATAFSPELVVVSLGFDAARGDFLGDFDLTPAGYYRIMELVKTVCGGKVVVVMEGGYNLGSIARSVEAVCASLLYADYHDIESFNCDPQNDNVVKFRNMMEERMTGESEQEYSVSYAFENRKIKLGKAFMYPRQGLDDSINLTAQYLRQYWDV